MCGEFFARLSITICAAGFGASEIAIKCIGLRGEANVLDRVRLHAHVARAAKLTGLDRRGPLAANFPGTTAEDKSRLDNRTRT
jgi:hypothetical protein